MVCREERAALVLLITKLEARLISLKAWLKEMDGELDG